MNIHLLKNTIIYSMPKINNSHGLKNPIANLITKIWIKSK